MSTEAKCPFMHTASGVRSNREWWPNQLNLKMLQPADPMGKDFNYAKEFKSLDLAAVKKAAAPGPASSGSRPSTAGPTTGTSTRRADCCGRSSRSTAGSSPGPTS